MSSAKFLHLPSLTGLAMALCLLTAHGTDGSPLPAPDYARPESWLALPGQPSAAGFTPKGGGFTDLQAQARADVFYIHPTTGMRKDMLNVPVDDPDAAKLGDLMLMAQATPFNGVARVYAPRYRQTALPVYEKSEDEQQAPMNYAYADVRRAFEHYAVHHNQGRPFFLVGHSQGANHAQRLLSELIQGTPLQQRMVAAYLPGIPLPRSVFQEDLHHIPPCTRPAQTGCAAVWGVFGEGKGNNFDEWELVTHWNARQQRWVAAAGQPLVNVNPVSWSKKTPRTAARVHRGAVPFGVEATHFTQPRGQLVRVLDDGRYALVAPPLPPELFNDGGVFGGTNYHVFDISLFWLDLRENARRRLNAFLLQRDKLTAPLLGPTAAVSIRAGQPVHWRVRAVNRPVRFNALGLPLGLALDNTTGVVTGVAQSVGVYPVILNAKNASGTDTADLALTVKE
jgi:hypothetical protein